MKKRKPAKRKSAVKKARRVLRRNPADREITLDDINAAIRGAGLNSMPYSELKALADGRPELFAGKVIKAAAQIILKSKLRTGLLRKNPSARRVYVEAALAPHRWTPVAFFPATDAGRKAACASARSYKRKNPCPFRVVEK